MHGFTTIDPKPFIQTIIPNLWFPSQSLYQIVVHVQPQTCDLLVWFLLILSTPQKYAILV